MTENERPRGLPTSGRKRQRTAGRRRSAEEKELVLLRFKADRATGTPAVEAANKVRTSLPSIYRWVRERTTLQTKSPRTAAQNLTIDEAIACLVSDDDTDHISRLEAMFKFIAWLRWPTKGESHPLAMTSCVTSYIHQVSGAQTLDELDQENSLLLTRHLRLDVLSRMCSSEFFDFPDFWLYNIYDQPYTELDALADIIWFILAYKPETGNRRLSASLNKAFYLLSQGSFKYQWYISRRTFRSFWADNAPAAPFLYIERFHSRLNWMLNPISNNFAEDVDELLTQREEVKRYFARCRWAVETLASQLDPRALGGIRFPRFPAELSPEPVNPPPLTPLIMSTISEYGQAYK